MLEQYSERSLRIISMARLRANRNGAWSLDVPHLLASLIIDDHPSLRPDLVTGIPALEHYPVLGSARSKADTALFLSATAQELLSELDQQCVPGEPSPPAAISDLPLSEQALNVLQSAVWLRDRFKHKEVAPMHLLAAALLRDFRAAVLFRRAGITSQRVLETIRSQCH